MQINDRIERINAVTPATQSQNSSSGRTSAWKSVRCWAKEGASKLTSRFVGQARRLPFFLVAAASVALALRLQIAYAQNAREQLTLDTKAHAAQSSITDATTGPILDKGGQVVNVKTFGAVGDGVTDDTAAFNGALASLTTAAGGRCLVPQGTYLISAITNPAITSHVTSNVHLVGVGRGASILKVAGMPLGNFLWCEGDNWSVEDLTIDMQDYFTKFPGFAAVVAIGNNWRITNCAIIKIGRLGINAKGGTNAYIEGNLITKTVATPLNNSAILGVVDARGHLPENMHIIDNACVNSAIYFNGKNSIIARNRVNGSGCGTNICTGVHSDAVSIISNVCSGGHGIDENKCYVSGFELWAPNSVIANNTSHNNDGAGIAMGGNNCIVIGNRCWNNAGLTGSVGGSGIVARAHPGLPNAASGSLFIGNSCFDTRPRSAMTQAYGYNEVGNGLKYIIHFGNDYDRNKMGPAHYNSLFGRPNVSKIQADDTGRLRISPAMEDKLKALANADDIGMSDFARRALREYLDR
jgi:Pectate lyase superfamily protein